MTEELPQAGVRAQLLGGRFRLQEPLASDPIIEVWRAVDETLDRPVTIKMLRPPFSDQEQVVERFRFEALAAAQLVHDHVASTFDVHETDGVVYTVSEFIEGPSVEQLFQRAPLPLEPVAALGSQIARGLSAAHEIGLIHAAVCPLNLLVSEDGRGVLIDFGSVRATDVNGVAEGAAPGPLFPEPQTVDYRAPEQIEEADGTGARIDGRADVYSLGLVLWEGLTGEPVPGGELPPPTAVTRLRSWLPGRHDPRHELREVLLRATARERTQRPSAIELAEELEACCSARPQLAVASLLDAR